MRLKFGIALLPATITAVTAANLGAVRIDIRRDDPSSPTECMASM